MNQNNRKYWLFINAIFILFFIIAVNVASAKSWHFVEWTSDIKINDNSTFTVREIQTVQFVGQFSFLQRGISLRNIRKISDVRVYDANMNPLPNDQYSVRKSGGEVVVRINFSAKNETRAWVFEYKVHGGIGFFDDHDEIYWNTISQNRDVTIDMVQAIVHLPSPAPMSELKQRLFIGSEGSRRQYDTHFVTDSMTLSYWGQDIRPNTHFTIVGSFPKGIVKRDWVGEILSFLWVIIPIGTFSLLLMRWLKKGKDPKSKEVIIPQYEPPEGLSPIEMSLIINEKIHTRDISATIIDLAYRGYIKIMDKGITLGNYAFQRQKKAIGDNDLKNYERTIINGIFSIYEEVSLDDLKNKFYSNIPLIRNDVFERMTWEGYFSSNPQKIRRRYTLLGILPIILSVVLTILGIIPAIALVCLIISCIMVIIFGNFMPCKTQKGADARWHALGFKEYLQVAERFRLEANVDPRLFDKYLSYALVFGVAMEWATRFALIYKEPPDWYVSSHDASTFSFVAFSSSISDMEHSFSSVLPSAPSSSSSGMGGGGSSGGGGGGGSSSAG